jgi:hypothetical protein
LLAYFLEPTVAMSSDFLGPHGIRVEAYENLPWARLWLSPWGER